MIPIPLPYKLLAMVLTALSLFVSGYEVGSHHQRALDQAAQLSLVSKEIVKHNDLQKRVDTQSVQGDAKVSHITKIFDRIKEGVVQHEISSPEAIDGNTGPTDEWMRIYNAAVAAANGSIPVGADPTTPGESVSIAPESIMGAGVVH